MLHPVKKQNRMMTTELAAAVEKEIVDLSFEQLNSIPVAIEEGANLGQGPATDPVQVSSQKGAEIDQRSTVDLTRASGQKGANLFQGSTTGLGKQGEIGEVANEEEPDKNL